MKNVDGLEPKVKVSEKREQKVERPGNRKDSDFTNNQRREERFKTRCGTELETKVTKGH